MSEQIKYHNLLTHKKQQIFLTKHDLTKLVFIIVSFLLSKYNSNILMEDEISSRYLT